MREIRQSGSEGGEAGTKPAFPTPIAMKRSPFLHPRRVSQHPTLAGARSSEYTKREGRNAIPIPIDRGHVA